jgi:hypothetical protein
VLGSQDGRRLDEQRIIRLNRWKTILFKCVLTLSCAFGTRALAFRAPQDLSSSGTLPPFSANFCITCLWSQMFIDPESVMSPL